MSIHHEAVAKANKTLGDLAERSGGLKKLEDGLERTLKHGGQVIVDVYLEGIGSYRLYVASQKHDQLVHAIKREITHQLGAVDNRRRQALDNLRAQLAAAESNGNQD